MAIYNESVSMQKKKRVPLLAHQLLNASYREIVLSYSTPLPRGKSNLNSNTLLALNNSAKASPVLHSLPMPRGPRPGPPSLFVQGVGR